MPAIATEVRPAYRPYILQVAGVQRLSPHFARVRLTGDDLEHFGTAGLDQRVKILFPDARGAFADVGQDEGAGDWYDRWRALPDASRNPFRTYTVRRIDPVRRVLEIDFVVHEDPGPAGAWVGVASVGDPLIVVGPDERSPHSRAGLDWHPGTARRVLLAGDETAVPAISGILEALPAGCTAEAFLEVPTAADAQNLAVGTATRVRWIARDGAAHGSGLLAALRAWTAESSDLLARASAPRPQALADVDVDAELLWDSPLDGEGEFYAWIAGEAAMVKTARRLLVSECGVDRKRVAFMGYWRLGQSERTG